MTQQIPRRVAVLLAVGAGTVILFGLFMADWGGVNAVPRHDKSVLSRMTEKMKTVCVGRFLIDLPEEASFEFVRPTIQGFDITTFDESDTEFSSRLAEREAELKGTRDRLGGNSNLELAQDVTMASGLVGKLFVHGRNVTEGKSSDGFTVDHYRYESVAVESLLHVGGLSIDLRANDYFPDRTEDLSRLVAQVVPNAESRIPSEPGFCIDRAYVRDPIGADQGERIMMVARLPSHPDIAFTLLSIAGTKPEDKGLLERGSESNAGLSLAEKARVTTLRARQRQIGGLVGDELVERFVEANNSIVYSFWWEVSGTADDVLVPHLSFTMDTGKSSNGPVPSSLPQGAAMALWDKVASSIRQRPTKSRKPHVDEAPLVVRSQRGGPEKTVP